MRGGLVLQEAQRRKQLAASLAEASGAPKKAAAPALDGDALVEETSGLKKVEWSLAFVGFVLYVFVMTTYQLGIGNPAMILALLGLPFIRNGVRFPPVVMGVVVFLGWCALGYFITDYPAVVYEQLVVLAKLCLILLTAVNVLRKRSNARAFILLFVLFYALYPARGTIFNYLAGYTYFGRALWNFVYSNSNDLAAITLLQLSMVTGLLSTERKKSIFWWGAVAATVVLPVVILLTKSRGVFIGLSLFGVFALLGHWRKIQSVALGIIIVGAILIIAPKDVTSRFGGIGKALNSDTRAEADPEGSAEQRYKIWQVSWRIIGDYPITGVGWGAYSMAHVVYAPKVDDTGLSYGFRDTHSTYFNLAAEVGFPGTFLFLGLVFGSLFDTERVRRKCRQVIPKHAQQLYFLEIGLMGFMVAAIFASYSRISFLYLHLAIMFALARACEADLKRIQKAARAA